MGVLCEPVLCLAGVAVVMFVMALLICDVHLFQFMLLLQVEPDTAVALAELFGVVGR